MGMQSEGLVGLDTPFLPSTSGDNKLGSAWDDDRAESLLAEIYRHLVSRSARSLRLAHMHSLVNDHREASEIEISFRLIS